MTWGNMLVITERCINVDAAWRYVQFVCSLEGNLIRSQTLGYNGPRRDFYDTEQWQRAMAERPYLSNVKEICLAGDKLRHTGDYRRQPPGQSRDRDAAPALSGNPSWARALRGH